MKGQPLGFSCRIFQLLCPHRDIIVFGSKQLLNLECYKTLVLFTESRPVILKADNFLLGIFSEL